MSCRRCFCVGLFYWRGNAFGYTPDFDSAARPSFALRAIGLAAYPYGIKVSGFCPASDRSCGIPVGNIYFGYASAASQKGKTMKKRTNESAGQALGTGGTRERSKRLLYKMTLSAIFIGLAVVAKLFLSFRIPFLGADGMRIGMSGVFTAFPAILCGPIYGGVASAASDLIGYLIKPDGSYIPWLTLTAFLGGVLKGLIWRLFTRRPGVKARAAVLASILIVGAFGTAMHVCLVSDGIISGFTAVQTEIGTRGMLEAQDKSPLSAAVVSLAKYNNDVFTVVSADDAERIVLPSTAELDGSSRPLTKIGKGAFSDCGSLTELVIPASYKTIADGALDGLDAEKVTVVCKGGSAAEKFAEANGFKCVLSEDIPETVLSLDSIKEDGEISVKGLYSDGFKVDSSDAFRKNLCTYISLATLGLELAALIGIIYFAVDVSVGRYERRHAERISSAEGSEEKKKGFIRGHFNPYLVKIMLATVLSGVVVTTVNTKILQIVLAVYNGRSFLILWIPRLLEEVAVCTVQSFLISLLYGVYISTVGKKSEKLLK